MTEGGEARARLDQEQIVTAGTALADAEGLAALSMRNLAKRLGFEVMSLYNHVANKDELLSLMVDRVADEVPAPASDAEPMAAVRALAVATHDVFVAHPWAPDLWLRHLPGRARNRMMETLLRLFADSGLSAEVAHLGFHAVNNHVLGYTLQAQGMAMDDDEADVKVQQYLEQIDQGDFPHMVAHVHQHLAGETGSSFEIVLDLILDGLVRLDDR